MSFGAMAWTMSTSPDWSALSVAVVSAIGRNVTASTYGPPSVAVFQYSAFFSTVTWSLMTHSLNLNGPVPTAAGGPPWAYLLFAKSGSLAPPASMAVGLWMPNTVSVSWMRNAEFGFRRFTTTVDASGASTLSTNELSPFPMTVSM